MSLNFKSIDRVKTISKQSFLNDYVKQNKPLVIEHLIDDWPAYQKWNLEYIQQVAGEKTVPLYNNDPVDYTKKVNEPNAQMQMAQYIDLLQREPTDLRIFLYNLMKEVPSLQHDFRYPDIGLRFLKGLPMLFFGGENSSVFMHYDIDYANIMHFHFAGKKRCILVAPEDSKYMYKVPCSVICREDIDFLNPDLEAWPALKKITPYETELNHGEVLYMPSGYWHHMTYLTPSFSMSLRSLAQKPKYIAQALVNLTAIRKFDDMMRKLKGQAWLDYKNQQAIVNTQKYL